MSRKFGASRIGKPVSSRNQAGINNECTEGA